LCRENNLPERETAAALTALGDDLELRGRLDEAEKPYREALAVYEKDPLALCDRSEALNDIGSIVEMRGDPQGSLPLYQQAYEGYKQCTGSESRGALSSQEYIASVLMKLGRGREALPIMQATLPAWRKLDGSSPDFAEPLWYYARANLATGNFAEAEKAAHELEAVQNGKISPTDRRTGASHMLLAEALAGEHRYAEALPHAVIADRLLFTTAISPGAKLMGDEAHKTLIDIQAKAHENGGAG
jgi:tetratricopeptide (TPR) repeat protein